MILDSETLEYAATALEQRAGNPVYRQAWKRGAKLIRSLKGKILITEAEKLKDKSEQIISI